MMNILITGGNGQLASCIKELSNLYDNKYTFVSHKEFDITDVKSVSSYLDSHNVDCLINCAAYTNVDKAEEDFNNAYNVNVLGPGILAEKCCEKNIRLIHISTDFVAPKGISVPFSGFFTTSTMVPNIYGSTKLLGENTIKIKCSERNFRDYCIIRTSWLYSEYGNNFLKTIYNRIKNGLECNVVDDQIGTPTYAIDLARFILELISKDNIPNILNYSNTGVASWFDFAMEIGYCSDMLFKINPCSHTKFERIAVRQSYSVMSKRETEEFIENNNMTKIPYWKDSVKDCISNIRNKKGEE